MKRYLIFALILIGFTSTLAQILLMRELAVVFYGNELSFGVILAGWLFWTGVGSSLLGYFIERLRKPIQVFVFLQILLVVTIFAEIFFIRDIRHTLGIEHGVMIGLVPMLLSCFLVPAPFCIISGFLWTLGCQVYTGEKKELASQIGKVYIYDGLGDILAGVIFTYFLVYFFHPFETLFYLFILNLSICLLITRESNHISKWLIPLPLFALLFLITVGISQHVPDYFQRFSQKFQWKEYNLVMSKDSIYGNIAITREENQYSFYESGLPVFSVPDKASSEQLIHFPMVMHPDPKHILIIGRGVSGGLTEILKHPKTKVHYVELDPMIIDLAKRYLSQEDLASLNKCQVHLMDGRLFVKRTAERFDLIMVNLPDPATAQLNRFYTKEFFKEVKGILNPDGVFALGITSDENYIGEELKNFNGCIYKTLKEVFVSVTIVPGSHLLLFASPKQGILTDNTELLVQRFMDRKIQTTYFDKYYFPYRLLPEKITFVKQALETYKGPANTDFYPRAYFYDLVFWATQFYPSVSIFFDWCLKINLLAITALIVVLLSGYLLISKKRPRFSRVSTIQASMRQAVIPIAIMTTGYISLALEIILIFGFQVLYGYIYHRIGMIIASFMLGLVFGTLWMNRRLGNNTSAGIRTFAKIEFCCLIYSFILPAIFLLISNLKTQSGIFIGVEVLFPILTMMTGFFVGAEFPLGNKLYLKDSHQVGKVAGLLYGVDLFGACLGGLLSTIIFIPILGIFQTCFICGLLKLASFILILRMKG
ncbi:MAG: fused MFS/spermidine synthase [bacterium]|nr:fused MFS/spermidine synthase [bacterium]